MFLTGYAESIELPREVKKASRIGKPIEPKIYFGSAAAPVANRMPPSSSPPAFDRPALDETFGVAATWVFCAVVGKEVGFFLVGKRPFSSWTRGASITPTGAKEQQCSWSTFFRVLSDEVPTLAAAREKPMEVMHERVAGLDVHKETVVACVTQNGCTHAAMEATGSPCGTS